MRPINSFHHMASAPLDGRLVELCYGLNNKVTFGYWHDHMQDWVDDNDHSSTRPALRFVTGWRPVERG